MSRLRSLFLVPIVPRSLALWAIVLLFATSSAWAQGSVQSIEGPLTESTPHILTNDSIIRMVKAGLGADLILQTVNAQPGHYTLDADAMIALKQAGVSDPIITAMVNKSRRQITPAPVAPVSLPLVNEIGVYYKDRNGNWVAIEPELVHIKSGGFIKSTLTNGIIKQDRNGHVNGRESKLALQTPIHILVYTPEGVAATEYDLLRFRIHPDFREFRTFTGGVVHSSSGAERDEVPFTPEKTAQRTYEFTIDRKVGGGEFGILPPGTGNITNGGKIYTFAITE